MSKFKVGDKVRRIAGGWCHMEVGDVGTVVEILDEFNIKLDEYKGTHSPENLELVEEKPVFNLKTDPWVIRVNTPEESEQVQLWLFENGIDWGVRSLHGVVSFTDAPVLTNMEDMGDVRGYIMYGEDDAFCTTHVKEIKFKFKTVIDSIEFLESETEQQKKIKELKATIEQATKQLQELEGL